MKKLLTLMSMLAVSTVAASATSMCGNHKSESNFDFSNSVTALQSGGINVLTQKIDKSATKLPEGMVKKIKNAFVLRLKDSSMTNLFANLKESDFKLTIKEKISNKNLEPKTFINNDQINHENETAFLEKIKDGKTSQYSFNLTPKLGNGVTFDNYLTVRDYIVEKCQNLLKSHDSSNPLHLFINPQKVNIQNFQEIFWNAALGQPRNFNQQKNNFEVSITNEQLQKLNHLEPDNHATVAIEISFKINNDFQTTQTGFSFKKGDQATGKVTFQTKLP